MIQGTFESIFQEAGVNMRRENLEEFLKNVKSIIEKKMILSRRNIISPKDIENAIEDVAKEFDVSTIFETVSFDDEEEIGE